MPYIVKLNSSPRRYISDLHLLLPFLKHCIWYVHPMEIVMLMCFGTKLNTFPYFNGPQTVHIQTIVNFYVWLCCRQTTIESHQQHLQLWAKAGNSAVVHQFQRIWESSSE